MDSEKPPAEGESALTIAARELAVFLAEQSGLPGSYLTTRIELLKLLPSAERARSDADEIVDKVLDSFCARASAGAIDPQRAGRYLARSLRHARTDYQRQAGAAKAWSLRESDGSTEDDAILGLFDSDAARETVYAGLSAAFRDRRPTIVRVVLEWIDLAAEQGYAPTVRDVAARTGLGHSTVADALNDFRERYLRRPD